MLTPIVAERDDGSWIARYEAVDVSGIGSSRDEAVSVASAEFDERMARDPDFMAKIAALVEAGDRFDPNVSVEWLAIDDLVERKAAVEKFISDKLAGPDST